MKSLLIKVTSVLVLTGAAAYAAQPQPMVPVKNDACPTGPIMKGGKPDTVEAAPDAEGFVSLFNGTDFKGWWEDCQTTHSGTSTTGAVWLVDSIQHLIFSREDNQVGSILVTNKSFDNYELILDLWPTFGNDGGVFNRMTAKGVCWQSNIDYIAGSCIGCAFGEDGYPAPKDHPFSFVTSSTINQESEWTALTATLNPTSFGCSAKGCVAADFANLWDIAGWNQFRVKFYDGLVPGRSVTEENYFRKLGAASWVPVFKKQQATVTPANPIGLQVHGQGRWNGSTWNVYRNIKIRPLDNAGNPILPTRIKAGGAFQFEPQLKITRHGINGYLNDAYDITITDVKGTLVDRFRSEKGNVSRQINYSTSGILIATLKNNHRSLHITLSNI